MYLNKRTVMSAQEVELIYLKEAGRNKRGQNKKKIILKGENYVLKPKLLRS